MKGLGGLERFDPEHDESQGSRWALGNDPIIMEQFDQGDWVRYSDVEALLADRSECDGADGGASGKPNSQGERSDPMDTTLCSAQQQDETCDGCEECKAVCLTQEEKDRLLEIADELQHRSKETS